MAVFQQTQRVIRIRGARTNNLRSVSLDVPRGALVVFAGVSGSGKSSLVFDTIAAEAYHQLNETYPPFVRNRLPRWSRPEVDLIDGLSPVVVIDQRRLGGNARSTVGTITDAYTYLRLIFSRVSEPHVGESNHFSFNDPAGMCPVCAGLGETLTPDAERMLDPDRSLDHGAILLPGFDIGQYRYRRYAEIGSFDPSKPLREWTMRRAPGPAVRRRRGGPAHAPAAEGLRGPGRGLRTDLSAHGGQPFGAQTGRARPVHPVGDLPGLPRRTAERRGSYGACARPDHHRDEAGWRSASWPTSSPGYGNRTSPRSSRRSARSSRR